MNISITTEFIKLDSLLKLAGLVYTGGEAKILIERGRKIRPRDKVCLKNKEITVSAE